VVYLFHVTGGEDECARAANIYQCGREKAPEATYAIQAAAASIEVAPVATVILPSVPVDRRFCRFNDLACVVNVKLFAT
jgi:hypothetical protein